MRGLIFSAVALLGAVQADGFERLDDVVDVVAVLYESCAFAGRVIGEKVPRGDELLGLGDAGLVKQRAQRRGAVPRAGLDDVVFVFSDLPPAAGEDAEVRQPVMDEIVAEFVEDAL